MVTKIAEPEVPVRGARTERVNVAMTPDMRAGLQRLAAHHQAGEAAMVRWAVAHLLEHVEQGEIT